MSLLVPSGRGSWVDARQVSGTALEVDRAIREGAPSVGWPGDPSMELTWDAPRKRWVVVRHCEDGVDRGLAWWSPEELEAIPACLAEMRLGSPGHEDILDKIDRLNDENEKALERQYLDYAGAAVEHLTKLWHDRTQPRNVFRQIPGRRRDD